MLGKILLTLFMLIAGVMVFKQRSDRSKQAAGKKSPASNKGADRSIGEASNSSSSDTRLAAYLFLIFMFGAAAMLYYFRWQNDHTIITVTLFGDSNSEPVTYQVYKYQLDSRSFTTIDGILITVANSERMEIIGLE